MMTSKRVEGQVGNGRWGGGGSENMYQRWYLHGLKSFPKVNATFKHHENPFDLLKIRIQVLSGEHVPCIAA